MLQRVLTVSLLAVLMLLCVPSAGFSAEEKVDPSGTWKWKRELEGNENESVLKLKLDKDKLIGTYTRGEFKSDVKNGKIDKDELSFEVAGKYGDLDIEAKFRGKVEKDGIKGSIDLNAGGQSGSIDWDAKRGLDYEDVVGKWQLRVESPEGQVYEPVLTLATDKDKKPEGVYTTQEIGEFKLQDITIKDADLLFKIVAERDGNKVTIAYTTKPAGDAIKGKVKLTFNENDFELDFTGKRMPEEKKEKPADKPAEKAPEKAAEKPAEKK